MFSPLRYIRVIPVHRAPNLLLPNNGDDHGKHGFEDLLHNDNDDDDGDEVVV